jgi:hypothetical protein
MLYTQMVFSTRKNLFNIGAGIYYYGKRHYIGYLTPRLSEEQNQLSL